MKFRQPLTDSDYLSVRCSLHVFERDMIVLIKSGTFTVSSAISMSPCQSLLLSVGGARARDARLTCIFRGIVSDNFLGWPDFVEIHVGIQTTKSVLGRHLAGTSPPGSHVDVLWSYLCYMFATDACGEVAWIPCKAIRLAM